MASLLAKVMCTVLFMPVLLCYVVTEITSFWSTGLHYEKTEMHLRTVTRIKQHSFFFTTYLQCILSIRIQR